MTIPRQGGVKDDGPVRLQIGAEPGCVPGVEGQAEGRHLLVSRVGDRLDLDLRHARPHS